MTPRHGARSGDDALPAPLRVLYVVDRTYWITASIVRRIIRCNPWIEAAVWSPAGLNYILKHGGAHYPRAFDVIHYMTPHLANDYMAGMRDFAACVTTIHHIEDAESDASAAAADAIMTVCNQWHEALVDSGVSSDKCVMIRNAAESEIFHPPTDRQKRRARSELGVDDDAFCIGYCGKKSSNKYGRKGIDTFIEAAERLGREHKAVAFVVLGAEWREVGDAFRKRGLNFTHRAFLPQQAKLARFYQALDMFWVTSRMEGGPAPLLEAMSTGLCCASTRVGIAREAIDHERNGFLLDFDDAAAFARLAGRVIGDPAMRLRIGGAARETVRRRFSPQVVTAPAAQLYRVALAAYRQRKGEPAPVGGAAGREFSRLTPRAVAREHLDYMRFLCSTGNWGAARAKAIGAITAAPGDRWVLRAALEAFPVLGRARAGLRDRMRRTADRS